MSAMPASYRVIVLQDDLWRYALDANNGDGDPYSTPHSTVEAAEECVRLLALDPEFAGVPMGILEAE